MLDCIYLLKYGEELSIIFFIVETVEEVYIIKNFPIEKLLDQFHSSRVLKA